MKANPKNNHLPLYNRSASGIYSFINVYRLNNFFPVSSILNSGIGVVISNHHAAGNSQDRSYSSLS